MRQSNNPGVELRRAAAEGKLDEAKRFLNKKFINKKSSNGNTALHWSVIKKHYAITKLLLTIRGIDVNIKNNEGDTPLHLAVKQGDKKTVNRLVNAGAGAGAGHKNILDQAGLSPLYYAFSGSYSFIATKLKQMLPHFTLGDEITLLKQAYATFKIKNPSLISNNQIFDLDYFLDIKKRISVYFSPGNKFTLANIQAAINEKILDPHKLFCSGNLLQSAAVSQVDTLEKFRWLLEIGVNPNLQASHELNPNSYKNTVLHTLIANEAEEEALQFIELTMRYSSQPLNFNLTDSEGKTCLCLAVKVGLSRIAKKLITLKADVNIPDEDGNTPLHYALLLGHLPIATELLGNQADINAKNKENKNPCELLNSTGIEDVRDCLETIWINPDRKIKHSEKTYIQHCMENRQQVKNNDLVNVATIKKNFAEQKRKSIGFLVAAATGDLSKIQENYDRYTLNDCNSKGNSALHLACQHGHYEIVKFLLDQPGIDLHKENNETIKAVNLVTNLFLRKPRRSLEPNTEDRKDPSPIRLDRHVEARQRNDTHFRKS